MQAVQRDVQHRPMESVAMKFGASPPKGGAAGWHDACVDCSPGRGGVAI